MKSKNVCKDLTFDDCELSILRMAVDKAEEKIENEENGELLEIVKLYYDEIMN